MNFIIFKISFYNKYNGLEDESLNIYSKFYQEKKCNNPEMYNFQDYNNFCYGYVSLKPGKINLSNIKFTNNNSKFLKNALIIWVYEDNNKYYIIGWYKNAIVYNFLQRKLSYPSVGRDLYFNVKAKSNDCYLLPKEDRIFNINVKFKEDTNFYIGDEKDNIYSNVTKFINKYNKNVSISKNLENIIEEAPNNPYLLYKRGTIFLYNEQNYLEALKYFNTCLLFKNNLCKEEIEDIYYLKALSLQLLNSFDNAIVYFEKILSNVNYKKIVIQNLIYLYMTIENYNNTIKYCDILLKDNNLQDNLNLDEINCLKAECYLYLRKYKLAKELLISIKDSTKSNKLIDYCENKLLEINKAVD